MNGGISTCPKTRKIFQCGDFAQSMSISQKNVWDSFWAVVDGFLGNRKDDRYFIPCLTPSSVKKWQKREFPISQKIFSSQKNENNSHDQCTLEIYNQQKNCERQLGCDLNFVALCYQSK